MVYPDSYLYHHIGYFKRFEPKIPGTARGGDGQIAGSKKIIGEISADLTAGIFFHL